MHAAAEKDLFEQLFAREYKGIVASASRIVGPTAAEDIAQEAFAALYRAGPTDELHARNWLYRTALHRSLDVLRAGRRREVREQAVGIRENGANPVEAAERNEARIAVATTLRYIHRRYAAVLALRYSGFSYREIAAIIDVNVNQIGTLLLRAEAAFKKEYDRVSSAQ